MLIMIIINSYWPIQFY